MKVLITNIFIACVLLSFGAIDTSAQNILDQILKRMDEHNKALTSLRADITMVKTNVQLGGITDTVLGTAIYLPRRGKDPLVRVDWKKPQEILSVVNSRYIIYRPTLKQYYTGTTDSAKGNAKAGGALAFMNMSRLQLKANYSVVYLGEATLTGGTRTWHLQLSPKVRTTYKTAEVWVDGNGMPVQSKVVEHNNDSTTVLLSNLQKNVRINSKEFEISIPPDTKKIEG